MDNVNNENIEVQQDNETVTKTLPIDMLPIFDLFAHKHCQLKGLRKGTPSYKENYDKFLFTLQHESYTNSLSTGEVAKDLEIGFMARNPSTPKIDPKYFQLLPSLFGEKGFFADNEDDKFNVEVNERKLRSIVSTFANLILETKYGIQIKRPTSKNVSDNNASGVEYKEDGKDKLITVRNQYMRLFYASEFLRFLDSMFNGKQHDIEDLINESLGSEISVLTEKGQFDVLNKTETRQNFVKYFLYKGKKPDILQNPMRKNPVRKNPTTENLHKNNSFSLSIPNYMIESDPNLKSPRLKVSDSFITFCPQVGIYISNEYKKYLKYGYDQSYQVSYSQIEKIKYSTKNFDPSTLQEPCVFGEYVRYDQKEKKYKLDHFLIEGGDKIAYLLENGMPTVDAYVLNLHEVFYLIKPTLETLERYKVMVDNYKKYKLANR